MDTCAARHTIRQMKKTKKQINEKVKFIPLAEWQETYQYHRTNKHSRQVDENGKR